MQERRGNAAALLAGSLCLVLSACGGGGNARPDPPSASTPSPAPSPAPTPAPSPSPAPSPAPAPNIPRPERDAHLTLTNAQAAHTQGLTGVGYAIGIVDSGVNRSHPTLFDRVQLNNAYVNPATNNLRIDDVVGHGTNVAQLAAGAAALEWPGGIAPGATVLSARIIADQSPKDDGSGKGNEITGPLGFTGLHNDLIRAGMRIMNNSWGGLYWSNPVVTAQVASEYRFFITDHDGLVVFAAGNEGRSNPSDMAALPSQPGPVASRPAADLERGWLTVVATYADDTQTLAHYSNHCGIAANYCLAAPGTAVMMDAKASVGGDTPAYYYGSGTSYAAPLVSGAAALVWEAFPYFTNEQVRQTLLGTAQDIGAPGVDSVFGHGLLDVGAAVNGPGRLDLGIMDVTVSGRTSTWSNTLTGSGGIRKRGNGTLVLSAVDNRYDGETRVFEGSLDAASLGTGDSYVYSGGHLLIRGSVGGALDNAGLVELAPQTGNAVAVDGHYVQRRSSTLALHVGDVLAVSGSANLQGGDLHLLGKRDYVGIGQRQDILLAEGGLSGQFERMTAPSSLFFEGMLDYTANGVALTLSRFDVSAVSAMLGRIAPASLESAMRIEAAFDSLDSGLVSGGGQQNAQVLQVAGHLQASTQRTQAIASLDSLAGSLHGQALAANVAALEHDGQQVRARIASTQPAGSWLDRETALLGPGRQAQGWSQGQQWAVGRDVWTGFAFGQRHVAVGSTTLSLGRSLDRQTQFHGWLTTRNGAHYALALVSQGQVDHHLDRRLLLGSWISGAQSRYGSSARRYGVEAGTQWGMWQPFAGVVHETLDSAGFVEHDPIGFGLRSQAFSMTRGLGLLGMRGTGLSGAWQWSAHAQWQQVLSGAGESWQARFNAFDHWAALDTSVFRRSHGQLGMTLQRPLQRGWLHAQLLQQVGTDAGLEAGLRWTGPL